MLAAVAEALHDDFVAAALRPDDESEVCRRLAPRVRLFARRRSLDFAAAEDFVQETLIAVLQALRDGRVANDPEPLADLALSICRGKALDAWRTGARRAALLERAPVPAASEPPLLDLAVLGRLLPRLEPRARRVVIETFLQGRQSAEIGERMGLSEANVRVLRHRGLATLREWMSEGSA